MILHISFKVFGYTFTMRKILTNILPFIVLLAAAADGYGGQHSAPYGDYPEWNSAYGICRVDLGTREAEIAIERYFAIKGFRVRNMRHRERFVEADIYKDRLLYDKILFDRKTGRIRSIY